MLGSAIENLVIVKLEEYSPYSPSTDGPLLSGGDVLDEVKPIYSYVSQHLAEAADEVLMIAPIGKLYPKSCSNMPDEDEEDSHVGRVQAPYDYLRIHTFRMESWKKPVHVSFKPGSTVYNHQFCPWTRGHIFKPVLTEDGIRPSSTIPYYVSEKSDAVADIAEEYKDDILSSLSDYVSSTTVILVGNDDVLHKCVYMKELVVNPDETYIEYSGAKYYYLGTYVDEETSKTYYKWGNDDGVYYTADLSSLSASSVVYTKTDAGMESVGTVSSFEINNWDALKFVSSVIVSADEFTYLHYYSVLSSSDHEIKQFLYVPHFTRTQEYDDGVAELIALNCAKKVCEVFERNESLTIISNEMQAVLQNLAL